MKRGTLSVVCAFLLLFSEGCAGRLGTVSNIPTNPTTGQPVATEQEVKDWDQAVRSLNFIVEQLKAADNAVVSLNRAGVFPDGQPYVAVLFSLSRGNQAAFGAVNYLKSVPNQFGQPIRVKVNGFAGQIYSALEDAISNGLLGIKNSEKQAEFKQILELVKNAVTTVITLTQTVIPPHSGDGLAFLLRQEGVILG